MHCMVWLLSDPGTVLVDERTECIERQAVVCEVMTDCSITVACWYKNSYDFEVGRKPQT